MEELISPEEEEIYLFGTEKMVDGIISAVSFFVIACLVGRVWELLIFLIAFKTLREYAGGYHASTRAGCYIITMGMMITVLSIQNYIHIHSHVAVGLWIVCGFVLFCLAPIEAENKPLDEEEMNLYGRKAKYIWGIQSLCFITAIYIKWNSVYENLVMANLCVAIALLTSKCKRK